MSTKSSIRKFKKIKSKLERSFVFTWRRFLIFAILVAGIACTYLVKDPIENYIADIFEINIETTEHGSIVSAGDLQVHFIDVGQGDSVAIRFPDDKTMLIDAGNTGKDKMLIPYLNTVFFKDDNTKIFDYALVTHSDADHCGSMDKIYEAFQINHSFRPYEYATNCENELTPTNELGALEKDSNAYRDYIKAVDLENDVPNDADIEYARAGIKIESDIASVNYLLEFITPNRVDYSNPNDYSPIMLLEYKDKKILLTGDATGVTFEELDECMNTNPTLKTRLSDIDVYKAAHHGSSLEGCNNLSSLKKLSPDYVVVCCGLDNKYKHPHQEFLDNLGKANVAPENIYRTDLNHNIVFGVSTTDGKLNIVSDLEVDPNASKSNVNNNGVILYYSWWLLASLLVFICAIICFYNYGYRKRNREVEDD